MAWPAVPVPAVGLHEGGAGVVEDRVASELGLLAGVVAEPEAVAHLLQVQERQGDGADDRVRVAALIAGLELAGDVDGDRRGEVDAVGPDLDGDGGVGLSGGRCRLSTIVKCRWSE
jgi:hypothetical protein